MKDDFSPEPEENGQHEAYDNIFIPPPINGSQKSNGDKYEDGSMVNAVEGAVLLDHIRVMIGDNSKGKNKKQNLENENRL